MGISRFKGIDIQKNIFAALSVGDILPHNLLAAALRNELSKVYCIMKAGDHRSGQITIQGV